MKRSGKKSKPSKKKTARPVGDKAARMRAASKAGTRPKIAAPQKTAKAPTVLAKFKKVLSRLRRPAGSRRRAPRLSPIPPVLATQPFLQREERYIPIPATDRSEPDAASAAKSAFSTELPRGYGDNAIWLMVRDPRCLYTYWEVRPDVETRALALLGGARRDVVSVLRVYDLTDRANVKPVFFDLTLQNMADDWYVEVQPNRSYVIEIGLRHGDGRFVVLARSNSVTTPRDGMSEILDEEWMGVDFDQVYALSGGFRTGLSSEEMRRLMQERLEGAVSSGSGAGQISSSSSPTRPAQNRKFWFVLDCELIVYGATEPGATVTIDGSPIQLRPDGTFTLRYALPDGCVRLDARAHSADGVEERAIIPRVERKTSRPDPVLKKTKEAEA